MADCPLLHMELSSFRSLSFQDVDFDNPTFVVGRNGSGKSNFADAFAFLSEAMVSPLQAVIERRGGFSAVSHRSSARGRPANLTLKVTLENPDSDTAKAHYYIDLGLRLRLYLPGCSVARRARGIGQGCRRFRFFCRLDGTNGRSSAATNLVKHI